MEDISTHALREEGDLDEFKSRYKETLISTHALREEGDKRATRWCSTFTTISTHALREEGDHEHSLFSGTQGDFYPRPP